MPPGLAWAVTAPMERDDELSNGVYSQDVPVRHKPRHPVLRDAWACIAPAYPRRVYGDDSTRNRDGSVVHAPLGAKPVSHNAPLRLTSSPVVPNRLIRKLLART